MRRAVAWVLFAAALAWSGAILAAPHAWRSPRRADSIGPSAPASRAVILPATMVYVAGSYVCHQRPERSFYAGSAKLPVCARCTGLYIGAPVGLFALLASRQRGPRWHRGPRWRSALAIAAVPTVLSILLEWAGGPTGNLSRFVTALPLGATVAVLVGSAVVQDPPSGGPRPTPG